MEEAIAPDFARDVASIQSINSIPKILEVICRATGMGFSAVARVTESRWIACAVRDEIAFGLTPGGELEVASTICQEIRDSGEGVVIDHVDQDVTFCGHPTPRKYGFQSYVSMPINLPNGEFFGTLCAIDPRPAKVNTPAIVGMFKLFADLVGLHLDALNQTAVARASEEALMDAHRRLDAALVGGRVATWVWEIGADRVYGDRNMFTLFKLTDDGGGGLPVAAYAEALHPDDRPLVMAALERSVQTGEEFKAEYRIVTTDPPRWAYGRASVERDANGKPIRLAGMVTDVTERKAAETELRAERETLRTVFDQAPDDAILIMDADRMLIAWNPAAERITGWTAAEAIGQSADLIFTAEDRVEGAAKAETERAAADGKTSDERWHVRKDGSRFWGSGTMNALHHASGAIRGYLKVFRDATGQHEEQQAVAFLGRITEVVIGEKDPDQMILTVERLVCEYLGASRVVYAEISDDGRWAVVRHEYAPGLPSIAGTHRVADYGPEVWADYEAGRMHISRDADRDYAPGAGLEAHRAIGAMAGITSPVIWGGRLTALLVVHQTVPRDWSAAEIALVHQVGDRMAAELERARSAKAVIQSESRLRALVTAISDVVYRMSPDWTEMWQLKGSALVADTDNVNPKWMDQYVHPDDQRQVRAAIAEAIAGKRIYHLEHRVLFLDGTVGWTSSRAVPLLDAAGQITEWFGTATDITDRKRAEAELAVQQHRLALIFRDSPAALALWSGEQLVFEQVNPGYQNLFPGRPLLGLPLLEALPELRGQVFDGLLRRVLQTGEPASGQDTLVRLARTVGGPVEDCYFDFSYHQVRDPDGNPWGVYNHAVDVTERVLARQALERSQGELRRALSDREQLLESERTARTEAELAGKMKDEFLATLSHELRTPLNAIVGWTQILNSEPNKSEDLTEGLEVIARNARAQTQIIEDILDMSRIISGKLRLDVQRVDLATVVRAGVDTVQPAADAKGVRLQVMLDPAAGPVTGDPGRLHQVFWNLLSNAVKFTPRGGRVQVVLKRANSHVEVDVADTGEGITPEFLPHVFDRFRQADASTTRQHGGLGLGLAIVKQLVELHGGAVRVSSPGKGQGATFSVELPLIALHSEEQIPGRAPREHPTAAVPWSAQQAACADLAGLKIVAVDDEADAVGLLARLLGDCGAIVRTARSAAEALDLIRSEVPTILISDIGMPGEDGYSLIRQVRALPPEEGGRVHALALTAYARSLDRMKALAAGFQMHLAKPVEPAELIVTVATLAKLTG